MQYQLQKLPDQYRYLNKESLVNRIKKVKNQYKDRLILLAHHYQRQEIVDLADYIGDSYDLARRATENEKAKYIVFCGVRFMAESAEILAQPEQIVIHPDVNAGCPLADMANINQVESVWDQLKDIMDVKNITPVVYINSDTELKAFCGTNEGTVCTSSKALDAMKWAFEKRDKVFFFPDAHLGENTAEKLQIPDSQIIKWDLNAPLGGLPLQRIKQARLILWEGYCHVHTRFKPSHIEEMRNKYPEAKIVVHPECRREVVKKSDAAGSTKYIVDFVQNSPKNSVIAIGTEINLVDRLARENPDKKILPLAKSPCPNMWKISLNDLCWVLENLGEVNVVKIDENIKKKARIALENMLAI